MTIAERDKKIIRACSKDETTYQRLLALYDSHHAEAAHYDFILNNVQDVIFETDTDGNWVFLSPAWEAITGFSVPESIGKHFMDYIQTEDRKRNLTDFQALIDQRITSCHREMRFRTRYGDFCDFDVNARLILDDAGQFTGTVGVLRDITERKQMQDRLRRSEANVRAMLDSTHQSFTLIDRERRVVDADEKGKRSAERIFGKRLEAGASIYDFVLPRDHESFTRNFQRALDGQVIALEKSFPTANGETLYFQTIYYPVKDHDEVIGVCMSHQDITERKVVEAELRASQDFLQRLIQQIPVGIQVFDLDGLCTEVNQAHLDIFGVERDDLVGAYNILTDTLAHEMPTRNAAERALKGETVHLGDLEFDFRRADSRYAATTQPPRTVNVSIVPIFGRQGEVNGFIGMNMDITDTKRALQSKFELALERERMQLLMSFIQNAAHEFRTPLATINTSAFIMSRTDSHPRLLEKYGEIEIQVKRITNLLDMLLLMVKLENTKTVLYEPIDLDTLMEMICRKLASRYGTRPHCQYQPGKRGAVLLGDPEHITDALTQVIDNAYRFTPPDGTITVSVKTVGGAVQVVVQDTGIGISTEDQAHIFETFWRNDESHSTPGFGLGLSIARRIIELHGGRIEVNSATGQGITVHISVPRTGQSN